MMKKYYVDNLIEIWRRDWFEETDDEAAIAAAETGDYYPTSVEYLNYWEEYIKTKDNRNYVIELYDEHGNLIKKHDKDEELDKKEDSQQ